MNINVLYYLFMNISYSHHTYNFIRQRVQYLPQRIADSAAMPIISLFKINDIFSIL